MTLTKKIFKSLLALSFGVALFSCGSNTEPAKEDAKKAEDSAVATAVAPAPAPTPPAFTPFDVVEITHTIKDYAKWRPIFDADSVNRKPSGIEDIVVGRNIKNPNSLMVVQKVTDMQKAKDFASSPKLKEAMGKAGVISKPDIAFFHVIRFNPDSKEKQWVVITHKVKNFDAWVKVFDNEGTAARASQGLVDVVLARGIEDSNMVHIVFDIKDNDMAKAKASIMSEEKKKLMMSAGVIGAPKIEFY